MATALESGSAEPHSSQISPPVWQPQDSRPVCVNVCVCEMIQGVRGERKKERRKARKKERRKGGGECVGMSLPH